MQMASYNKSVPHVCLNILLYIYSRCFNNFDINLETYLNKRGGVESAKVYYYMREQTHKTHWPVSRRVSAYLRGVIYT